MCGTIFTPGGSTWALRKSTFLWMLRNTLSASAPLRICTMPSTTSSLSTTTPSFRRMAFPSLPRHLGALHADGNVAHPDRSAILRRNHGLARVVGVLHQSNLTNVVGLLSLLDETATSIEIVIGQRLLNLSYREA